jgi:prolyl-tRNA synthetase
LGQNFARAFDVFYQTESGTRELVWATSWGVSTRLIGAMVMSHSDDKGLVLPPPVAPQQVVIVPITKGQGDDHDAVMKRVAEVVAALKASKIRVKVDDRLNLRPGAKYFEWERKGVPIRLEIGPRDVANNGALMALRPTGEKRSIATDGTLVQTVTDTLKEIHAGLLAAAKARLVEKTFKVNSYEEMKQLTNLGSGEDKSKAGFYLVPWKCDARNEDAIKEDCKATIRCYPLDLNMEPPAAGTKCFYSGDQATHWAIFARAF